jgi:hypothetical protein
MLFILILYTQLPHDIGRSLSASGSLPDIHFQLGAEVLGESEHSERADRQQEDDDDGGIHPGVAI